MSNYKETKSRSLAKTIIWRVIATFITWLFICIFTGAITESIKITLYAALAGMITYYIHKRVWNIIIWGKVSGNDHN